jgi:HAD superfamily hydrolase (TIGR01509 family)
MGHLRGIVFDLDDTLIGSTQAIQTALHALKPLLPHISPESLMQALARSYQELWGYLTPGYATLRTITTPKLRQALTARALHQLGFHDEPLLRQVRDVYAAAEREALAPLPGVPELVRTLAADFTLGVLTNGPSCLQREKLAQVGLAEFFTEVVADADFGAPKPDFGLFIYTQEKLGLSSGELMFVGDSVEADVVGANHAGWLSVYVGHTPCKVAAYSITRLEELLTLEPVVEAKRLAISAKVADTRG